MWKNEEITNNLPGNFCCHIFVTLEILNFFQSFILWYDIRIFIKITVFLVKVYTSICIRWPASKNFYAPHNTHIYSKNHILGILCSLNMSIFTSLFVVDLSGTVWYLIHVFTTFDRSFNHVIWSMIDHRSNVICSMSLCL